MREISLPLPGRDQSYRILIDPGLRLRLPQLLVSLNFPRRCFVVTDTRVGSLYGDQVATVLKEADYSPTLLTVPRGERAKTWPVAQRLARELLALGADRGSLCIALGGGVVGDLTGFLASIFMRGVPFIQVPTTLLAMVDAAIGGKTAINLPEGKNLLGTFHQPRLVIIDPQFLRTLPGSQRRNGLAEVIKHGFIQDPDLLSRLEQGTARIFRDEAELTEMIHRAAAIKAKVVAADEREGGLRRILNFGHTLGHALEQASHFRLPHGEAVAWGMLAALRLSEKITGLPPSAAARGRQLIRQTGLARRTLDLDPQTILEALPLDKKRQEGRLIFVLLRRLGEPVIQADIPLGLINEALQEEVFGEGR
ncbi:MAG: 3-dehydroquinate synthase [Desulfobaccales bacterium]